MVKHSKTKVFQLLRHHITLVLLGSFVQQFQILVFTEISE